MRTATLEVEVKRAYVEAASHAASAPLAIAGTRDPAEHLAPVLADAGLRLTFSILIIASVDSSASGLQPPTPDWALMINENRDVHLDQRRGRCSRRPR